MSNSTPWKGTLRRRQTEDVDSPIYNPLLPVTVSEELRNKVDSLEIQVAVTDTLLKLETIRRKNIIDELLRIGDIDELRVLQKYYMKQVSKQ